MLGQGVSSGKKKRKMVWRTNFAGMDKFSCYIQVDSEYSVNFSQGRWYGRNSRRQWEHEE